MFLVKKLIAFFLSPLVLGFILGGLGFYFLYQKKYKKAKLLFLLSFSWIFLISYNPVASSMLAVLENQYPKLETIPKNITYILALGGDSQGRSYELLRLYQKNKRLKIITSGYEPKNADGAYHTAQLLIESGIPTATIIIKQKSKDTKEEAVMMKSLVDNEPFILVTSAYHMPRAITLFRKMGLHPIAAPTDFLSKSKDWFDILSTTALKNFEKAFHEYLGLLWYILKGDI